MDLIYEIRKGFQVNQMMSLVSQSFDDPELSQVQGDLSYLVTGLCLVFSFNVDHFIKMNRFYLSISLPPSLSFLNKFSQIVCSYSSFNRFFILKRTQLPISYSRCMSPVSLCQSQLSHLYFCHHHTSHLLS